MRRTSSYGAQLGILAWGFYRKVSPCLGGKLSLGLSVGALDHRGWPLRRRDSLGTVGLCIHPGLKVRDENG